MQQALLRLSPLVRGSTLRQEGEGVCHFPIKFCSHCGTGLGGSGVTPSAFGVLDKEFIPP